MFLLVFLCCSCEKLFFVYPRNLLLNTHIYSVLSSSSNQHWSSIYTYTNVHVCVCRNCWVFCSLAAISVQVWVYKWALCIFYQIFSCFRVHLLWQRWYSHQFCIAVNTRIFPQLLAFVFLFCFYFPFSCFYFYLWDISLHFNAALLRQLVVRAFTWELLLLATCAALTSFFAVVTSSAAPRATLFVAPAAWT